jgi:uncharacterized protein (TIGR03643 family)
VMSMLFSTATAPAADAPMAAGDVSRVIEVAWEDRTPFEDIEREYGLDESAVIALMRREMKASSFRMWRKRVTGRVTKHEMLQEGRMRVKRRGSFVSVEDAAPGETVGEDLEPTV